MEGTGGELAGRLTSAIRRLPAEMLRAEEDNARLALAAILRLSEGEISSAALAALGHPYSIGGSSPQDPAIINRQSGEFLASWHQDGPRVTADGSVVTTFENISEHATYLEMGTSRMIARPLMERVEEEIEEEITARRDRAILVALGVPEGGR